MVSNLIDTYLRFRRQGCTIKQNMNVLAQSKYLCSLFTLNYNCPPSASLVHTFWILRGKTNRQMSSPFITIFCVRALLLFIFINVIFSWSWWKVWSTFTRGAWLWLWQSKAYSLGGRRNWGAIQVTNLIFAWKY